MKLLLARINHKKIWQYDESKNILMRKGLDYPINLIIISLLYGIVALLLISRIFLVFLRWQQIIMGGGGTKAWDDKWALCYLADRRVPLKSEPAQSKDSEPNIKKVPRKSRCKAGGHQSVLISKTLSTTACQLSRNFPIHQTKLGFNNTQVPILSKEPDCPRSQWKWSSTRLHVLFTSFHSSYFHHHTMKTHGHVRYMWAIHK